MTLGMISWIREEDFQRVKAKGLSFVELDVNDRVKEFLDALEQTKEYSKKYDLPVAAIGRWGSARIDENGIREEELAIEYSLIDAAAELGTGIYITGCNYVDSLSYYENCSFAIAYFEKLIAYGKEKNIKIATYNCRWNNFVCNAEAYKIIHGYLKDLYIKYDTSHCINAGGDYLQETRDWGKRFIHVHLKGAVKIEGKVYDNPPAGMDQTDWTSFMGILYGLGYDGGLSIEPESAYWHGELSDRGVDENHVAIPSLLAVSALQQYLVQTKKRTSMAVILESGEPRDVHHFATLLGFGASAINPYLAQESIQELIDLNMLDKDYYAAVDDYNNAIINGIVKLSLIHI